MCQFASFLFKPDTMVVKVYDVTSHHATADHFNLDVGKKPNRWREGHYLPNGEVACRVLDVDDFACAECRSAILSRWPTFAAFSVWAHARAVIASENIYVRGCDLKGVKLPESVAVLR